MEIGEEYDELEWEMAAEAKSNLGDMFLGAFAGLIFGFFMGVGLATWCLW